MAFIITPFLRAIGHICGCIVYVEDRIDLAKKWIRNRTTKPAVAKQDVKNPGDREEPGYSCCDD
jgi:hypothetical protein